MINKSLCLILVSCLLSVLVQPVVFATEDITSRPLSAVERVAKISEQLGSQRRSRAFWEPMGALLATTGLMSVAFLFPRKEDGVVYLLLFAAPIGIIASLHNDPISASLKYMSPTPIENDYKKLSGLSTNYREKEKQAFVILQNNAKEEQKPEGKYSFYEKRHWVFPQLGPNIDTDLIRRNYEEYLRQTSNEGYLLEKE